MAHLKEALAEIFKGEAGIKILRFLWRSGGEWSGREIARQAGVSAPSCHEALKKLKEHNVLTFRRVSHVHLYALNSQSYWVQEVLPALFRAEGGLREELIKTIREGLAAKGRKEILSACLFGSAARGEEESGSDIDVFVVYKDKVREEAVDTMLEEIKGRVYERFGLPLAVYKKSEKELRRASVWKLPVIKNVIKENIMIYGKNIVEKRGLS